MEVHVNEQPQRFYLAMDKWEPVVGHGIQIGDIQVCAIPIGGVVNITEVTSGAKVMRYKLNFIELLITEDKEGFLNYLQYVGEDLVKRLSKHDDLDQQIKKMQAMAIEKLGPRPAIEDIVIEELLEGARQ